MKSVEQQRVEGNGSIYLPEFILLLFSLIIWHILTLQPQSFGFRLFIKASSESLTSEVPRGFCSRCFQRVRYSQMFLNNSDTLWNNCIWFAYSLMMYRFIHHPLNNEPSFTQDRSLRLSTSRDLSSQGSPCFSPDISLWPIYVIGQVGTCQEAELIQVCGEFFKFTRLKKLVREEITIPF